MNGVDLASQLRGGFSCHKPQSSKWWKPIFYWLMDICVNNAYLIWRTVQYGKGRRGHKTFIDTLYDEMLDYDMHTPAPGEVEEHTPATWKAKGDCAWGKKSPRGCVQGSAERGVLREISGNVRVAKRPRQTRKGCLRCGVHLCTDRLCWRRYHGFI